MSETGRRLCNITRIQYPAYAAARCFKVCPLTACPKNPKIARSNVSKTVGCRPRIIKIHSSGKELGTIDLATCGSVYGFSVGVSEEVTESILTGYLLQQGGKVNRSSRLVGLTPHPGGVLAEIEHDGDRYQMDAQWVVGCDGIHSATCGTTAAEESAATSRRPQPQSP